MCSKPLSIVVVSHLAGDLLNRCLDSLLPQLKEQDQILVLISAQPGQADIENVRCEPILLGENVGFARAANEGFARSKHKRILLLNDDTVAEANFLDELREASDHPGLYQPKILLDDETGCIDNMGHGLYPDGFNWGRGRGAADSSQLSVAEEIGACSGAAMLIRREVLEAIGPFDEDLVAFGEDVDLSLRALRAGFPIRLVPSARIRHVLGASYGRYNPEKLYLVEKNRVRAAVRSMPMSALLTMPVWTGFRLAGLSCVSAAGKGYASGVSTQGARAAAMGLIAGVRNAPDAWRKRKRDAPGWALQELAMWERLVRHRIRLRDVIQ
jgi:GT2 family glycosyltransferase